MRSRTPRWRLALHRLPAGARLGLAAAGGTGSAALAALAAPGIEALLLGWCSFAALSLWLSAVAIAPVDGERRRGAPADGERGRRTLVGSAARNDQSSTAILAVVLLGCAVSVTAIFALLISGRDLPTRERWPHGLLALAAIVLSWLLIHVRFGFHYAHRDLQARSAPRGRPLLAFPETRTPDYLDFMYFSFVIGMTSQVSDVQVVHPAMRRLVLWHSLLSFAFNLLILALAVNALVGLV